MTTGAAGGTYARYRRLGRMDPGEAGAARLMPIAVRAFATGKRAHYKIPRYFHLVD